MKRKRCSVLILATALLIIGMRGVCTAHYAEHVSDTQKCNEIQMVISIDKSMQTRFVFRVKRYFYVPPKQSHICAKPLKRALHQKPKIPPKAVGGSVQMLSKQNTKRSLGIPPAVAGGFFKSFLRKDLKYPPTAVGGIYDGVQELFIEGSETNPPTAVGGIYDGVQ
jgi:hypothetical protein